MVKFVFLVSGLLSKLACGSAHKCLKCNQFAHVFGGKGNKEKEE